MQEGGCILVDILMVVDALVAILLIAAVVMQSGKSAGLGTIDGGAEALFGGRVKGIDQLLSKITMVLAVVFAALNIFLAKMTIL